MGKSFRQCVRVGVLSFIIAQIALYTSFAFDLTPNKFINYKVENPTVLYSILSVIVDEAEAVEIGNEVLSDTVLSGSRRILSILAGIDMLSKHPIIGVGYLQSPEYIDKMTEKDLPQTGERLEIDKAVWGQVHSVDNASIRVAAETGFIGLAFFWLFCFGIILVLIKSLLKNHRVSLHTNLNGIKIAAAVWGLSFIIFNQTVSWMYPAHMQLIWLSFCFGIVNSNTRIKELY